jgi:hypothetical protein
MPVCRNCGVEIDLGLKVCPLCGEAVEKNAITDPGKQPQPQKDKPEKRYPWFLELFSFFAFAAFIIVFAVDFAYGANLTWSRIPMVSIFFSWLFAFLLHHLRLKPYLLVTLETINFLFFLWALDLFISSHSWFLPLALPLILILGILFLLVIVSIRTFKLSTLSAIAVGTFTVGIFLLCLEIIINLYMDNFFISWSIVAFACIIPVSGLFLYLQVKNRKKGSDLKKIFHI